MPFPVLLSALRLNLLPRSCFVAVALCSTLLVCPVFAQTSSCLPSAAGVRICEPDGSGPVGSAVTITAGAVAQSGTITAIRAYVDGSAVFTVYNPATSNSFQVTQEINADAGNRDLTIVGYQSDGGAVVADTHFNSVTAAFADCIPGQPGAVFCRGVMNGLNPTPIQISAGASAANGYITAIRLYVDDVSRLTVYNPQQSQTFAINEPLALPQDLDSSTSHTLILVGYDSTGGAVTAMQTFQGVASVPAQACAAPGSPGVNVCSPQPDECTVSGFFHIRATGTGATGPVDHMELWTDSGKIADFPGNSINTNLELPDNSTVTIVAVDINGQPVSSAPFKVFIC